MKKHLGLFIKLVLLLAFLSRLEFVFGQAIGFTKTKSLTHAGTGVATDSSAQAGVARSMGMASTLGEEIGFDRLVLKASPKAFNSKTFLSFTLRQDSTYKLEILSMQGYRVTVLAEGNGQAGESFAFQFKKGKFPAGAYIGRLVTDHEVTSARFVLE